MLTSDIQDGKLVFCDRSAGSTWTRPTTAYAGKLPHGLRQHRHHQRAAGGRGDPSRGDAMMALVETPCDAACSTSAPELGDARWPQATGRELLDTFRYPRRLSYRFAASGGYVALAQLYTATTPQTRATWSLLRNSLSARRSPASRARPSCGAAVMPGGSSSEARTEGHCRRRARRTPTMACGMTAPCVKPQRDGLPHRAVRQHQRRARRPDRTRSATPSPRPPSTPGQVRTTAAGG